MGRGTFFHLLELSFSFISHGTWKIRILILFDKNCSQAEDSYTKWQVRTRPILKDKQVTKVGWEL